MQRISTFLFAVIGVAAMAAWLHLAACESGVCNG